MIYILYLYFLGLLSSISIMDGFHTIFIFSFNFYFFKIKYFNSQKEMSLIRFPHELKVLLKLLLFWALWIIVCYFVNEVSHPFKASFDNLRWILFIPACYFVSAIVISNYRSLILKDNQKKSFLFLIILTPIILLSLYSISVSIMGINWLLPDRTASLHPLSTISGGARASGFFDNPMTFAHSFGVWICLLWGVALVYSSKIKSYSQKIFIYFVFTVFSSAIAFLLTFTRGAWLSVAIGVLFITFIYHRKLGQIISLLVTLGISGLLILSTAFRERIFDIFKFQDSQSERLTLWKANWLIIKEHPLFGVGHGQNYYYLDQYYQKMGVPFGFFKSHAHNQFIQFAAGSGIVGLIFYLVFIMFLFKTAIKYYRETSIYNQPFLKAIALGTIAVIIHLFFGGLFESNFEDAETLHNICFSIGFLFALNNSKNIKI